MSRVFHPSLSTLDIAKFQLMEQGFVGISNGVTLIPAKCVRTLEAKHLNIRIMEFFSNHEGPIDDDGPVLELLGACKAFFDTFPEDPSVSAIVVFKPSVEDGVDNVQPVGRIIDPWEVVDPEFAHTDGAGNVREDNRAGNNPPKLNGSSGNEGNSG